MRKLIPGRLLTAALSLCLFFIVVGSHWAAFDAFGSDIPNWDQWDAEGLNLLAPWFEHDHFITHLFLPHNEHRVVITKLQNLALTLLSGQWDARLESVINATVHAALAVAFWFMGRRWIDGNAAGFTPAATGINSAPQRPSMKTHTLKALLFVALAALFATPVAWQNVLGGFHSQQYWLLLLSFLAIVALPFARTWSLAWFASAFVTAVALLTMGSGFFAAAMVFCISVFRLFRRQTTLQLAWPTLVLTLALVVVGLLTRVEVVYHQALKAKTAQDFFLSMLHSLQWPAPRAYSWLAAVLWLPWVLMAWRVVRAKSESRAALTIVALGGWVVAQIVATAYARGVGGDYPASRYMDTLVFGIAANAVALAWLLKGPETGDQILETKEIPGSTGRRLRVFGLWSLVSGLFALSWLSVFAWGVYDLGRLAIKVEMADVKRFYGNAEAHMRGYLATRDPAQLDFPDIPYPSATALLERLNHESLRSLLPVSIRLPLPMEPAGTNGIFLENLASQLHLETASRRGLPPSTGGLASLPTWGSFSAGGATATGDWMSAPLTAPLGGWLKFETAGDIGRDGIVLELRGEQSHRHLADVRPTKIPGDFWRAAYVRAPSEPFVVVARDTSAAHWLAFSAPVEMSNLSYLAWQCTRHGRWVALIAAAAAAVLGLAVCVKRDAQTVRAG